MSTVVDDHVALFDFVWQRFKERMAGLLGDELAWQPTADPALTLRWRLVHIAELLGEDRNATWLGVAPAPFSAGAVEDDGSVGEARAGLAGSYARWRAVLTQLSDDALGEKIGPAAGAYATSTRLSFVLHVADELIHHTAEAAMFRDLYAAHVAGAGPG